MGTTGPLVPTGSSGTSSAPKGCREIQGLLYVRLQRGVTQQKPDEQ
jgi:hypothetical protein